jgi:hypothetical protein
MGKKDLDREFRTFPILGERPEPDRNRALRFYRAENACHITGEIVACEMM